MKHRRSMLVLADVGEEVAVAGQSAGQGDDFAVPGFEHRRGLVAAEQFLGAVRVTQHFQYLCWGGVGGVRENVEDDVLDTGRYDVRLRGPFRLGTKVVDRANAEGAEGRQIVTDQPGELGRSVEQAAAHLARRGGPATEITQVGNGRDRNALARLERGGRHHLGPLKSRDGVRRMQRKPMWLVAVSTAWGERAAGRYRRQYSGAQRWEPPLRTRRGMADPGSALPAGSRALGLLGAQQESAASSCLGW